MISVTGMALPGFSGSFILILLGNYVLLLVDSVNVLFDTFVYLFSGDFSFMSDPNHMRLLKVLLVFTLGSVVGHDRPTASRTASTCSIGHMVVLTRQPIIT